MTTNVAIVTSFRLAKMLIHRMTDDLTAAEFNHQPVPGANSAAWIVGHLAATYRRMVEKLGRTDLEAIPEAIAARLAPTRQAAEDQSGLGEPAELLRLFDVYCDASTEFVAAMPASRFDEASPFPLPFLKTIGEALIFIGSLHATMHSGQLSTIRRSLGKPPVS